MKITEISALLRFQFYIIKIYTIDIFYGTIYKPFFYSHVLYIILLFQFIFNTTFPLLGNFRNNSYNKNNTSFCQSNTASSYVKYETKNTLFFRKLGHFVTLFPLSSYLQCLLKMRII